MTTPETAAETAAAAKMTSAAKVLSASAAKVASTTAKVPSASAATAPECHGASRHRSYAEGKCCSNCNHHFAHGISLGSSLRLFCSVEVQLEPMRFRG
jgi:hypothetical protein